MGNICKFLLIMLLLFFTFEISLSRYSYSEATDINFDEIFVKKENFSCGEICGKILLSFYGKDSTSIKLEEDQTNIYALSQQLENSKVIFANQQKLKCLLTLKKPCIVTLRNNETDFAHVIVKGYNAKGFHIIDANGNFYDMNAEKFMSAWSWSEDLQGKKYNKNQISKIAKELKFKPNLLLYMK